MTTTIPVSLQDEFEVNGHVAAPGFLSASETAELTKWIEEIAAWPESAERWMHHHEHTPLGVRLARSENLLPYHADLRGLLTQGKIPAAVGQLLGEPAVLYKEKINYKYPGGGGYAPHQDAPAYEFVQRHITCLVAVDDATPANGCLYFASGWHRQGLLPLDADGCIDPVFAEALTWQPLPMRPGDALFFSSYAPHKSPPNRTDRPRRSLYLTYNALADGNLRDEYYRDKRLALAEAHRNRQTRLSKINHFRGQAVP